MKLNIQEGLAGLVRFFYIVLMASKMILFIFHVSHCGLFYVNNRKCTENEYKVINLKINARVLRVDKNINLKKHILFIWNTTSIGKTSNYFVNTLECYLLFDYLKRCTLFGWTRKILSILTYPPPLHLYP